ncbi:MAG TPA: hypothetical protein PKB06_09475 [Actinotalea sp.]|nr:hypothetical protein [Actinotalea sp.]
MPLRRTRGLDSTDLTAVSRGRRRRATHDLERVGEAGPRRTPDPVTGIGLLDGLLDRAVTIPSAAIHEHVRKLRRRNPYASPEQIIALLDKQYLLAISASGGAVGAAAAAPAVGTGVGIALTTSEVATFFAASSAYALAVASVHGIEVEDVTRRRTLLLATVLGEQGSRTIGSETGLGSNGWARSLLVNMPTRTIKQVNRALTRRLIRAQATRQGALAFGRLVPFGIGAVVGVTGARALGRTVIVGAQRAFGPPPLRFPDLLELHARVVDAPVHAPGRAPLTAGPGGAAGQDAGDVQDRIDVQDTTDDGWRLPGT